jgi:threonine dehydratase
MAAEPSTPAGTSVAPASPKEVAERAEQVAPLLLEHLTLTPLLPFAGLAEQVGTEVLVKCEHLQRTGSFKARGSLAKVRTLSPEQRERGVVTASSGNHGLGVAHALAALGGRGIVYVPETASPVKVAAIRRFGAEVRAQGSDSGVLEVLARRYAAEHGLVYVSPYNDLDVIAGQGSIGVELLAQAGERGLDAVFVAVGGGGLISGVASVLKRRLPGVRVYGASPSVDAAMAASVAAGRVVAVDAAPTLSDGTAGSVEEGAITLPLCRALVDEWVLVGEAEIRAALRLVIDTEHQLIEGAAAAAAAAALARRTELAGQRVAIVSCGANISADTLAAALTAD